MGLKRQTGRKLGHKQKSNKLKENIKMRIDLLNNPVAQIILILVMPIFSHDLGLPDT